MSGRRFICDILHSGHVCDQQTSHTSAAVRSGHRNIAILEEHNKSFFQCFTEQNIFKGFQISLSLSGYIYLFKIFIVVLCFCLNFLKSYHNNESLN